MLAPEHRTGAAGDDLVADVRRLTQAQHAFQLGRGLATFGLLAGGALWVAVARRSPAREVDIFAGVLAFCAGSMLLAAIGRSLPFPDTWNAARYQSPVLVFWACLVCGWIACTDGWKPARRA